MMSCRVFPEPLAPKVPQASLMFWVIKLLTTVGGVATSDILAPGSHAVGAAVEAGLLVAALAWQFRVRRYTAAVYWFLGYVIAVAGTGVTDVLHRDAGLPSAATTLLSALILAAVFVGWERIELSTCSIVTRPGEVLYWAMVFASLAFGTALADFTATSLDLGYGSSVVVFLAAVAVPAVDWCLGSSRITAFWWAYVLTWPLGASAANYVSKAPSASGLGLGDGPTALTATLAAAAVVVVASRGRSRP
jgi:uncharacterized membrane-anchored protein